MRPAADLLHAPVLGRFLRWRHARTTLQSIMLALAALIILDGLFGPQIAPRNLAGVLPWVHWRGFVVLALLVAGNLFCAACPFMLPRRLAKRLFPGNRPVPRVLRGKWLAVALLFAFFWAYEAFDLWASPWLTAWVVMTYFALAFAVDAFFRGAAFCKHVCPIGQFHFVNAMVSPLEVRVRNLDTCANCSTKDCIRGRYAPASPLSEPHPIGTPGQALGLDGLIQSGCELALFQPRKEGNLDCTFCMECIHACPHDNVGILLRSPIREFASDPVRSGVGRISRRPDFAALALLLTFGAFLNAFGMVEPVYALQSWVGRILGTASEPLLLALFFVAGLGIIPLALTSAAAWASGRLAGSSAPLWRGVTAYAWSLVPLGLGMWAAHYLYHFLTGGLTIVPVVHEYLSDLGVVSAGSPRWGMGSLVPESWLFPIQLILLQLGLFLTLLAGHRIALREEGARSRALRAFAPWAVLATFLALAGIWLFFQPMEMRGTFQAI